MDARPFPFEKLPKVSRQETDLLESLQALLPRTGFDKEMGKAVRLFVRRELGVPFSFKGEKLKVVHVAEKVHAFSRQGVFVVFGLPPLESRGVLEIDPMIAHMAIDRMLGGPGHPPAMLRELTDIEEAVLSYLFLKIFAIIFERCGGSPKVHFRMEKLCTTPDAVLEFYRGTDKGLYSSFQLSFGDRAGYARLILPLPLAEKSFLEGSAGAEPEAPKMEDLLEAGARLRRLGFLQTSLWTELGRTTLQVRDINGLEPGDVVVLENTQAHVQNGRLTGALPIRVGTGERGSLRGTILPDDRRLKVRLDAVDLE